MFIQEEIILTKSCSFFLLLLFLLNSSFNICGINSYKCTLSFFVVVDVITDKEKQVNNYKYNNNNNRKVNICIFIIYIEINKEKFV